RAFDTLLVAIGNELWVLECSRHGCAQCGQAIGWYAGRRSNRTAGGERRTGGSQERLIVGVGQEVGRKRHRLGVGVRGGSILEQDVDCLVLIPGRTLNLEARPER